MSITTLLLGTLVSLQAPSLDTTFTVGTHDGSEEEGFARGRVDPAHECGLARFDSDGETQSWGDRVPSRWRVRATHAASESRLGFGGRAGG